MDDDFSLLGFALSLASQKAQTFESLSAALKVSGEDLSLYWFAINEIRRCQGRYLPLPPDAVFPNGESTPQHPSNNWYAPTWKLNKLLEQYQLNESLAVHYERILTDPEGGHYELNLAASEIVLAVWLENNTLNTAQLKRVCVQACEPTNGIELLVANAGKILLNVENYRTELITSSFIENLYADLTEGISIKEVLEIEGRCVETVEDLRSKALESLCSHVDPFLDRNGETVDCRAHAGARSGCDNQSLISALIALHYLKTFRLFPAGNSVLAYLMYFLILHRAGYHFSAHIPIIKLLYTHDDRHQREHCLARPPENLAVECNGFYDWTSFFERAVELIIDEQCWTMTKLDDMNRRRERFRCIIDADKTLNFRQKEVLLEAALHSNAEFTYAIHEQRYDISYPCARSDFVRLLDMGFLMQCDDGIRHFFVACDTFKQVLQEYSKKRCPEVFFHFYNEDGSLRDEYKSTDDIPSKYNKDVGFYEKSLLDKTYIEHQNSRRAPIADYDGPQRRSQLRDKKESLPAAKETMPCPEG
ncbi:MAG: hypothetical protein RR300_03270 [Raoultibacter sp.]